MAQIIKIKRSTSANTPSSGLQAGELAYSFGASGGGTGSNKLFIGDGAGNNYIVGGKLYTDLLTVTAGDLTANKAIVVDSNSKIDQLKTANLTLGASSLTSGGALTLSGSNIAINGTGQLTITHNGTIDLDAQTNAIKIKDNSATALVIQEDTTPYLSVVTTDGSEAVAIGKTLDVNGNKLVLDVDGDTSITADTDDEIHVEVGGADKFKFTASSFIPAADGGVALGTSSLKFGAAYIDNIKIDGSSITSENTNGNINITPNGTGKVVLDGLSYPTADGSANQFLKTDGSGNLSFSTVSTSFTLAADSGSNDTFNTGETLRFTGGSGIATVVGSNVITFNAQVDDSSIEVNSDALRVKASGITNAMLAGSIANSKLANSAVTVGSTSISLGSSATSIAGLTQLTVDHIRIDGSTISSQNTDGNIILDPNGNGVINASSSRIINVSDPTQSSDAATKSYVDAVKQALDIKESVHVATTAAITIATDLQAGDSIDGVTLVAGDRVLVKNQSDASENGIYVAVASGAASRSTDANTSAKVTSGLFVFVEEGTANGDNGYVLTTNDSITLGNTDLVFTQFSGAGAVEAGSGLTRNGTTINANTGNTLQTSSDTLNIKGVTTTATGDIILGSGGANGGYTRLAVGSTDQMLKVSGGTLVYTDTIDGGTFT